MTLSMAVSKRSIFNTEKELLQVIKSTNELLMKLINDLKNIKREKGTYTQEEIERANRILLEVKKIRKQTYSFLNPKKAFKDLREFS